jgi:hypothetical protein
MLRLSLALIVKLELLSVQSDIKARMRALRRSRRARELRDLRVSLNGTGGVEGNWVVFHRIKVGHIRHRTAI